MIAPSKPLTSAEIADLVAAVLAAPAPQADPGDAAALANCEKDNEKVHKRIVAQLDKRRAELTV